MKNFYVLLIVFLVSLCKISNTFPRIINNQLQTLNSNEKLLTETTGNNSSDKTAQAPELDNIRDKIPVAHEVSSTLDLVSSTNQSTLNSIKQKRCPSSNLVGSARKTPLLLSRRDTEADKERCEKCRNTHLCAVLGKCNLCNNLCQQFDNDQTTIQIDAITPTEPNNEPPIINSRNSPMILESKFGGEENVENAGRFYTVAAFNPGTRMSMLARLLNLKKENIDKLIVLAKIKDHGETEHFEDPIIFDISNAFTNDNKTILYKLKTVVENEALKIQLTEQLMEYLKSQEKSLQNLNTEEIDRMINKVLEIINQVQSDDKTMLGNPQNGTDPFNTPDHPITGSEAEARGNLPMNKQDTSKAKADIEEEKILPKSKPQSQIPNPAVIEDTLRASDNNFHKLKNLVHQSYQGNGIDFDKNGILGRENSHETLDIPISKPALQSDNQSLDNVEGNNKLSETNPEIFNNENPNEPVVSQGTLADNIMKIVKTNLNNPSTMNSGNGGIQQVEDTLKNVGDLMRNVKANDNQQLLGINRPLINIPTTKPILNNLNQLEKNLIDPVIKSEEPELSTSSNIVGIEEEDPAKIPGGLSLIDTQPKKLLRINKISQMQPILKNPQPLAAQQEKRLNIVQLPNNMGLQSPEESEPIIKSLPQMPLTNPTIGNSPPQIHTSNLPNEFPYNLAVDFQENPKITNPVVPANQVGIPQANTGQNDMINPLSNNQFAKGPIDLDPNNIIIQPKELIENTETKQETKPLEFPFDNGPQSVQKLMENKLKMPLGEKIMNLIYPRISEHPQNTISDSTETELASANEKNYKVGKIVPVRDNKHPSSQVFFVGDGIKLPLQMVQKKDGSLQLTVDVDRICDCPDKTCPKQHIIGNNMIGSQTPEGIVGSSLRANNGSQGWIDEFNALPELSNQIPIKNFEPFQRNAPTTGQIDFPKTTQPNMEMRENIADNLNNKNQFNTLRMEESVVGQTRENSEIAKRSPKFDETHTMNDNNILQNDITNEKFDDLSKIRDLYEFQQLENQLESKLENLNKNIEKIRMKNDNIMDKGTKSLFKTEEADENVKRRIDIFNNVLGWMKDLLVTK